MACLVISSLAVVILVTLLGTILISGQKALYVETDAEGIVVSKFAESHDHSSEKTSSEQPSEESTAETKRGFNWNFLTGSHKVDDPENSGIGISIIGSCILCLLCAIVAVPIGIGTAIFLEEFQPRNRILRWLHGLVQLNISNLAGVPSIVYGILGLTTFVYMFNLIPAIEANKDPWKEIGVNYFYQTKTADGDFFSFRAGDRSETKIELREGEEIVDADGNTFTVKLIERRKKPPADADPGTKYIVKKRKKDYATASRYPVRSMWYFRLPFGKSLLSAALTLALVILPIVIISSQEAIRAVPRSIREAAFGMGATRWQVVRKTVLPAATPGIMTGAILAMSRAIGEAAPVLAVMGGLLSKTKIDSLMDQTPVLPVTIFTWAGDHNAGFENASSAAIIVLLIVLLIMNSFAIFIRNRYEKKLS